MTIHTHHAPDLPRRHTAPPGWSGLCPDCRAAPLQPTPAGSLACPSCRALIPAPPARLGEPFYPSGTAHPTPELDARVHGAFDRYSRPGGLLSRWGRSTQRAPWTAPPGWDPAHEDRPPAVVEPWHRGQADAELDAAIAAEVATVQGHATALRGLRSAAMASPRGTRKAGRKTTLRALLLAHCAEVAAPAPDGRVDVGLGLRLASLGAGPLARALRAGLIQGAALLMANALLRRGVDVWALLGAPDGGPIEPVPVRLPRAERWAGVGHVVAVADSAPLIEPAGLGALMGAAHPRHALPTGMQMGGRMAVAPTHTSAGRAPGVGRVDDMVDAQGTLSALHPADVALLRRAGAGPLPPEAKARLPVVRARVARALRKQGLIPQAVARRPVGVEG